MSSINEKVVPDWVWQRRWRSAWTRKATIALGLILAIVGIVIIVASFEIQTSLPDTCTSNPACVGGANCIGGPGCIGPNVEQSPLHTAWTWSGIPLESMGTAMSAAGFVIAIRVWRTKEWEWTATLALQPVAKRLEQLYSKGKITKGQVEEILQTFTQPLPRFD